MVIQTKAEPDVRLKPLKSYAHALCQMLIGWRMSEDLELFAQLPDGTLSVDVLTGSCVHSVAGELTTHIAPEMAAWFRLRLEIDGVPLSRIAEARVNADVTIVVEKRRRDRRVHFGWRCRSLIATPDSQYSSSLKEPHTWCSGLAPTQVDG